MTTRKRILFVDDDPDILASFRRLFFRDRQRWDLVFVSSGDAALTEMSHAAFDTVVSDLRMPMMDGIALMRAIARLFPSTVRILLTGGAAAAHLDEAETLVDHVLSKPCDTLVLRAALDSPS